MEQKVKDFIKFHQSSRSPAYSIYVSNTCFHRNFERMDNNKATCCTVNWVTLTTAVHLTMSVRFPLILTYDIQLNPAISNEDRIPLDLPGCFQSFTISYFEFPAISNSSFFPYSLNQPRYFELVKKGIQEQTPKRPRKSEVRQTIETLSRYSLFAVEGAEIGGGTNKQLPFTIDNSTRKNQKQQNKIFQCNSICWFIRHIKLLYFYFISVFLHTVLSFIRNDSLLRILRFPGYFETPLFQTFFRFPCGFEIAGFNWSQFTNNLFSYCIKVPVKRNFRILFYPPNL